MHLPEWNSESTTSSCVDKMIIKWLPIKSSAAKPRTLIDSSLRLILKAISTRVGH